MADYTSIRVRSDVADDARRLSRALAVRVDRNISLSDTLAAALTYAAGHEVEIAATLAAAPPG
jgi:hypothetical protein